MSTMTFTRETLAALFQAAAAALAGSVSETTRAEPAQEMNYPQALEIYINAHSRELGTLAGWLRKKYSAEPTPAKAKSLLTYAQKQIDQMRADPQGLPVY